MGIKQMSTMRETAFLDAPSLLGALGRVGGWFGVGENVIGYSIFKCI